MQHTTTWGEVHEVDTAPTNATESITIDGIGFRPESDFGAWFEVTDPKPSGTVGRLHMPMNVNGTPDIDNLGDIEVAYEDA